MAAHVATLYTVQVREKSAKDFVALGDINGAGAALLTALHGYMNGLAAANEDATKTVTCTSASLEKNDLLVVLKHGQRGVAADIIDDQGKLRVRQRPADTQTIKCACVFRLPPAETMGWLALHVNNNRGAKTLLAGGISGPFRDDFPDLMLDIKPAQIAAAVREAVDDGKVDKIKLVKIEKPTDRANQSTSKWVRDGVEARLELDITARGHVHLIADRIAEYLHGQTDVFNEIVVFEGMTFEEAKVEVDLPGGKRTFNLTKPEAGHPITEDLEGLAIGPDGDPTDATLFRALRAVLTRVTA